MKEFNGFTWWGMCFWWFRKFGKAAKSKQLLRFCRSARFQRPNSRQNGYMIIADRCIINRNSQSKKCFIEAAQLCKITTGHNNLIGSRVSWIVSRTDNRSVKRRWSAPRSFSTMAPVRYIAPFAISLNPALNSRRTAGFPARKMSAWNIWKVRNDLPPRPTAELSGVKTMPSVSSSIRRDLIGYYF